MSIDAIIATKVNDGLKHCAAGFARSATECSNSELRNFFLQSCEDAIRRQEQLVRLMEQKGWYRPPMARHEDIQQILPQLQALSPQQAMAGVR